MILLKIIFVWSLFSVFDDVINDPYTAALIAVEITGLNGVVQGAHPKAGAAWLIATGMIASNLVDLRKDNGTAIHARDAHRSTAAWKNALRRGDLNPEACEHHADKTLGWSTRGSFDTMAAYTLKYVPGCQSPDILDVPIVSAYAAAERAKNACKNLGACTPKELRYVWAGLGTCKRSPNYKRAVERKFKHYMKKATRRLKQRM